MSILPILLLLFAAACGDEASQAGETTAEASVDSYDARDAGVVRMSEPAAAPAQGVASTVEAGIEAAVEPGVVPGTAAVTLTPMLVRTGQAVLQVDSLEEGITRVRALALRVGAVTGNTTITAGSENTRRAQVELRIPSERFDEAVGGLSPIGKVQSVNVTAEDVGEEYTDVSARVANARRLEARLLDLLERRTGRLDEILNLEREVARVREEIERYEGRLRYLRTRASVSLLTITLHEPQTVMSAPGERPLRDAFATAWRGFIGVLAGLIAMLGMAIPLGILAFVGWRAFRALRRRDEARDAAYREMLRRERARAAAPAPADAEAQDPAALV